MAALHGTMSALSTAPPPDLKMFRPQNLYVALGLAVNHLMTKPAFANLRFGDWSRILVGRSIASTTGSWSTATTGSTASWVGP
jgi:hypothetical protein